MFDVYNSSGYDLYQPFDSIDQWIIDPKSSQAYHGSLRDVVKFMINKFEFNFEDIENSLEFLAENIEKNHNGIHMGMNRTPIYTFKKVA